MEVGHICAVWGCAGVARERSCFDFIWTARGQLVVDSVCRCFVFERFPTIECSGLWVCESDGCRWWLGAEWLYCPRSARVYEMREDDMGCRHVCAVSDIARG